jgi:hypothetical protein
MLVEFVSCAVNGELTKLPSRTVSPTVITRSSATACVAESALFDAGLLGAGAVVGVGVAVAVDVTVALVGAGDAVVVGSIVGVTTTGVPPPAGAASAMEVGTVPEVIKTAVTRST